MEPPNQLDESPALNKPPKSDSEQNSGEGSNPLPPTPLIYRRSSSPVETPESSPERGHGGVRLSPVKLSPSTTLPQPSTESSLQHGTEDENVRTLPAAGSQSANSPGQASSDWGLRRRSLTSCARLPPRKLPHHFFPDAPRSVSSPEPSARSVERTTLDGTIVDTPAFAPSPTRQENTSPSNAQGSAEREEHLPQEPPAYQPRLLNLQRRRPRRFHRLMPSRSIRCKVYNRFRLVSLDLLFLFVFLALTGIILLWGKLWRWEERLFPMTFDPYSNTWYGPIEFSYPQHDFILGITTTGIMIPLIPLAVILLTQIWIRSWLDFHAALFALKKAMVMMYVLRGYIESRVFARGTDYK